MYSNSPTNYILAICCLLSPLVLHSVATGTSEIISTAPIAQQNPLIYQDPLLAQESSLDTYLSSTDLLERRSSGKTHVAISLERVKTPEEHYKKKKFPISWVRNQYPFTSYYKKKKKDSPKSGKYNDPIIGQYSDDNIEVLDPNPSSWVKIPNRPTASIKIEKPEYGLPSSLLPPQAPPSLRLGSDSLMMMVPPPMPMMTPSFIYPQSPVGYHPAVSPSHPMALHERVKMQNPAPMMTAESQNEYAPSAEKQEPQSGFGGISLSFGNGRSISFGGGQGLTIGGRAGAISIGGKGGDNQPAASGQSEAKGDPSDQTKAASGYSYDGYSNKYASKYPTMSMDFPRRGKKIIHANLDMPPKKVRLHSSPRVKVTTGSRDPLEKPSDEELTEEEEDIFEPPAPFPKRNATATNETMTATNATSGNNGTDVTTLSPMQLDNMTTKYPPEYYQYHKQSFAQQQVTFDDRPEKPLGQHPYSQHSQGLYPYPPHHPQHPQHPQSHYGHQQHYGRQPQYQVYHPTFDEPPYHQHQQASPYQRPQYPPHYPAHHSQYPPHIIPRPPSHSNHEQRSISQQNVPFEGPYSAPPQPMSSPQPPMGAPPMQQMGPPMQAQMPPQMQQIMEPQMPPQMQPMMEPQMSSTMEPPVPPTLEPQTRELRQTQPQLMEPQIQPEAPQMQFMRQPIQSGPQQPAMGPPMGQAMPPMAPEAMRNQQSPLDQRPAVNQWRQYSRQQMDRFVPKKQDLLADDIPKFYNGDKSNSIVEPQPGMNNQLMERNSKDTDLAASSKVGSYVKVLNKPTMAPALARKQADLQSESNNVHQSAVKQQPTETREATKSGAQTDQMSKTSPVPPQTSSHHPSYPYPPGKGPYYGYDDKPVQTLTIGGGGISRHYGPGYGPSYGSNYGHNHGPVLVPNDGFDQRYYQAKKEEFEPDSHDKREKSKVVMFLRPRISFHEANSSTTTRRPKNQQKFLHVINKPIILNNTHNSSYYDDFVDPDLREPMLIPYSYYGYGLKENVTTTTEKPRRRTTTTARPTTTSAPDEESTTTSSSPTTESEGTTSSAGDTSTTEALTTTTSTEGPSSSEATTSTPDTTTSTTESSSSTSEEASSTFTTEEIPTTTTTEQSTMINVPSTSTTESIKVTEEATTELSPTETTTTEASADASIDVSVGTDVEKTDESDSAGRESSSESPPPQLQDSVSGEDQVSIDAGADLVAAATEEPIFIITTSTTAKAPTKTRTTRTTTTTTESTSTARLILPTSTQAPIKTPRLSKMTQKQIIQEPMETLVQALVKTPSVKTPIKAPVKTLLVKTPPVKASVEILPAKTPAAKTSPIKEPPKPAIKGPTKTIRAPVKLRPTTTTTTTSTTTTEEPTTTEATTTTTEATTTTTEATTTTTEATTTTTTTTEAPTTYDIQQSDIQQSEFELQDQIKSDQEQDFDTTVTITQSTTYVPPTKTRPLTTTTHRPTTTSTSTTTTTTTTETPTTTEAADTTTLTLPIDSSTSTTLSISQSRSTDDPEFVSEAQNQSKRSVVSNQPQPMLLNEELIDKLMNNRTLVGLMSNQLKRVIDTDSLDESKKQSIVRQVFVQMMDDKVDFSMNNVRLAVKTVSSSYRAAAEKQLKTGSRQLRSGSQKNTRSRITDTKGFGRRASAVDLPKIDSSSQFPSKSLPVIDTALKLTKNTQSNAGSNNNKSALNSNLDSISSARTDASGNPIVVVLLPQEKA